MAMGNRIAMEMSTLDSEYRGKINQLYSETQSKLDAMDEFLRKQVTTAATTTTTINTIFNRFNEDKSTSESGDVEPYSAAAAAAESILVKPFLENDNADIVANKKKYGKKRYDPQRVLNAWRQNWNLLPDGALGTAERDQLDLNYDELYGRQDLKDLADDVSWFPKEDMEKTGLIGHFEDAGEVVYRLYESDLEPQDDFYYSDYDYDDYDNDASGERKGEEEQEETVAKEDEKGENQNQLQLWRERFSVRDRFSNSERTQPQPEQETPAEYSPPVNEIIFGKDTGPNANPSIMALMSYNDRDVSGGEKVEEKPEEEVVEDVVEEEEKEEHSTYPEVVDRAEQLQDKLEIWREIFSVHTRFPNSERTRPRPEQVSHDDSVSEDLIIMGENPSPNANPSIMALMK